MAIPAELDDLCKLFWESESGKYDFRFAEGCGLYTEAWVRFAKANGYPRVENLAKEPGQTQWNGHAVDAFLYAVPYSASNPLYQAVDIILAAESADANYNWGVDTPRYTAADIWVGVPGNGGKDDSVPWVPYDENSFQELKRSLAYDYARRPQPADFDVSVWAARTFHNAYMGPEKKPLGMDAGTAKARKEWCAALGVPVIPVPSDWNIGDPVS